VPTHKPSLRHLTTSQLGELTGRKTATVKRHLQAAGIDPVRVDGRSVWWDARAALAALFGAADEFEQALMLVALNCGFANTDLSELRLHQLALDGDPPILQSRRHKTGVYAKWALWPETVEVIRNQLGNDSRGDRVFAGKGGRPLVKYGVNGTHRDDVGVIYDKLRKRSGLETDLTFKFFRKTGGDWVKQIGGHEASEMYLAHSESSRMNRFYANRVWPEMHACLDEMRQRLLAAGVI